MTHLLHPELIHHIPITGPSIARSFEAQADVVSQRSVSATGVTVAIRAMNQFGELEGLLRDISRQQGVAEIETLILDTGSVDTEVMRGLASRYDARFVAMTEPFTHPKSRNKCMAEASHDLVFLTNGHSRLSTDRSLQAGVGVFVDNDDAAGAFARVLPNTSASQTERTLAIGNRAFIHPDKVKKVGLGVLAGQNAMISKAIWSELGRFDERYESGGDDTALAAEMIKNEFGVYEVPLLGVHHSHALSLANYARQVRRWKASLKGPQPIDYAALAKSRPDLDYPAPSS